MKNRKTLTNYESLQVDDYPPKYRTTSYDDDSTGSAVSHTLQRAVGSMNDGARHNLQRWISKHVLQSGRCSNKWAYCSFHAVIVLWEGNARSNGWYDMHNVVHDPQVGCNIAPISVDDLAQVDLKVSEMIRTMRNLARTLQEHLEGPGELADLQEQREFEDEQGRRTPLPVIQRAPREDFHHRIITEEYDRIYVEPTNTEKVKAVIEAEKKRQGNS